MNKSKFTRPSFTKFKPEGFTLDFLDDDKEEPTLTEQNIIENIKIVYDEQYRTSDKPNTSNTITKLYDIIDLNKPNVNTVENINKIIEVYKKEVTVQEKYVEAVEGLNKDSKLYDQIYIPKIIDHGIIFVKDNDNISLPNDIKRVKSFGEYVGSKRERTIGIGLEYEKDNPSLKRHFFEYDLDNMSYDIENMTEEDKNKIEEDKNKIIYNNILEREDDNGVKHDKFDNEYITKSFSLFYFIQMEKVPDGYELWREFTDWSKEVCDTQLNNLKTNLQEEITKPAGYVHGDINSSNIFVKKEGDNYKYALIDFGEATEIHTYSEQKDEHTIIYHDMFQEKITLQCPTEEEKIEKMTEGVKELKLGGKKKTKRNRINKKRKTYKRKKTKTNKNINKKNKTKKQFLYNPDDPKKSFDVYIDKDPTDTIPIKYTTIDDVKTTIKTLEKLYKQNEYPHKRIWQVGMIMKVRLEAMLKHKDKLYPNAKNVKSRFDLANKYFLFLRSRTKEKDEKKRKEMKFNH